MQFPARFPWRFGAHDKTRDQEHQALLDALSPGWDTSEGTELESEAWADAVAVTMIWQANRRFGNQAIPTRMLDVLASYERACNLRPRASDSLKRRRHAVAAKLRGLGRNTFSDLEAAASQAAGSAFVDLVVAAAADVYSYWPGINPGPPGYEYSSNRAIVCVHLRDDGLSGDSFGRVYRDVVNALDAIKPSWLRVNVGMFSS